MRRYVLAGRLTSYGRRYEHRTLSRADVGALACEVWDWRHAGDIGGSEQISNSWKSALTAAILGISRQRLDQLARADRVPYVRHRDGTRLYRRAQLEVMSRR